jgi:rRNA-processing protein FCF1
LLVLLDTSILIFLVEKRSSFLDDLGVKLGRAELCVPDSVIKELRSLTSAKGPRAKRAREALSFAESMRVFDQGGEADDALASLAQDRGAAVATLDRRLIASLRRRGVPVATVKDDRLLFLGKSL